MDSARGRPNDRSNRFVAGGFIHGPVISCHAHGMKGQNDSLFRLERVCGIVTAERTLRPHWIAGTHKAARSRAMCPNTPSC